MVQTGQGLRDCAKYCMPDSDYAFEAVDCAGTQTEGRKSVKDEVPQGRIALGELAA